MRRRLVILVLALPLLARAAEFAEGEVWAFKARPHEPNAKVGIAHIERNTPEGDVYFIHLLDVKLQLKGPPSPAHSYGAIAVKKETLEGSVIRRVATGVRLPYESGLASWKEVLEKHKVGAYRKSLPELLEHLERTVFLTKW